MASGASTESASVYAVPSDARKLKFSDTVEIDHRYHRLYMGDTWSGGVDVFDISSPTPSYIETIRSKPMRGPYYGVCVADDLRKLFVAHGTGMISVIDLDEDSSTKNKVIATADNGGHVQADLIDYDPVHRKVYYANRNEGFITAFDAVKHVITARIEGLGRALEQPRFNPVDEKVYQVSNSDDVIHQIDPSSDRLLNTFEIGDNCNANGLAINPNTNQALLGSDNDDDPHTLLWDLETHRPLARFEECGCGDGVAYDPVVDRFFFAASGFPHGPVIGVFGGDPVTFRTNIPTTPAAGWVAFDRTHRRLYTPAIEDDKPALLSVALPEDA